MTEPVTRPFLFPGEWQPPARRDFVRNRFLTFVDRAWWSLLAWDVLGPTFRALVWLGLWDLREGDYYVNGWWCWGNSRAGDLERYWHPGWRGFWKSVRGEW